MAAATAAATDQRVDRARRGSRDVESVAAVSSLGSKKGDPVSRSIVFLSLPGLRDRDVSYMPQLRQLVDGGSRVPLTPSFPAVTWPVQTNMLTGQSPSVHGIVANGWYWREARRVEMWTAGNEVILAPQLWDVLHQCDPQLTSAVWFPMLAKGCGADIICMPAPIHNPDGTESLWCYSRPLELYGELRDRLGHFPLQHFWGPLAGLPSSAWIAAAAVMAAARYRPHFFFIYLPHLDYAAQKWGPDSAAAIEACRDLDTVLGRLVSGFQAAYPQQPLEWFIASEYAILPVSHVVFPNRLLRQAGLLAVRVEGQAEQLDLEASRAWTLVDHQAGHVFVERATDLGRVADLFRGVAGIDEVLVGQDRQRYGLDHPRAGDVVLISEPHSWQAYYWWLDERHAPPYARTVDIHRKPGYDPVELHWDAASRSIPLDARLVQGSHGAPARTPAQRGVLLASQPGLLNGRSCADRDVFEIVLRLFR